MREVLSIAKALADESRLRVLLALKCGELCVCQIVELLELAPSTVSKHMAILQQAGLVDRRKDGRWIYYRLAGPGVSPCAADAARWITAALARDVRIRQDARRVKEILQIDREQLCQLQCQARK